MSIEMFLFSTRVDYIRPAIAAGIDGIIVDWENVGKERRQANVDTQINHDTVEDLARVRAATSARVICRINGGIPASTEIDAAVHAGADEILVPMVRSPHEVERALDRAAGRCGVGILAETRDALACAADLARLPIARVYVGLNDLRLERNTPTIFTAITDGTVERLRDSFTVPFGFGGVTLPHRGSPLPCRLLMAEMMRLRCDFTFLRRSFTADVADPRVSMPLIREAFAQLATREQAAIARDHAALQSAVRALDNGMLQAV